MSLDKRVTDACHRIEELWNETEGKCYVSFSGGKDSTVLLALIKMCQELYTVGDIPAVFSNTGIELGVTVDFVRWVKDNYYPNVKVIRPGLSFDAVIKKYGKPIKSKIKSEYLDRWQKGNRKEKTQYMLIFGGKEVAKTRFADKDMHMLHDAFPIKVSNNCCRELKKKPFHKHEGKAMKGMLSGLRAEEGGARFLNMKQRLAMGGKLCTTTTRGLINKLPIVDWTDDDIEQFIEQYHIPLSDAYTKYGFKRTGCMCCPFSRNIANDLKYLYYHEPNRYKASMHWLKDVYIAQNVILPFDESYERERERMWSEVYEPMRQEMLRKYRPNSRLIKDGEQLTIFEILGEEQ